MTLQIRRGTGAVLAVILSLLISMGSAAARTGGTMTLSLTSPDFANMGPIPARYTCEGENISPPLIWSHLPAGTRSLVLIVDDPDAPDPAAPKITWVHWLVYNIPPDTTGLEASAGNHPLPRGVLEGIGNSKHKGYSGPCPPIGTHRYFHKLYALDVLLPDLASPDKAKLEAAMKGHVLGEAVLIGTYRKAEH